MEEAGAGCEVCEKGGDSELRGDKMFGDIEFKIHVIPEDYAGNFKIVPVSRVVGGDRVVMYPAEGTWVEKHFARNESIPNDIPVLRIPREWAEKLFHALADHFVPKGPTATEQELGATKYHLEDMRALVFKEVSKKE